MRNGGLWSRGLVVCILVMVWVHDCCGPALNIAGILRIAAGCALRISWLTIAALFAATTATTAAAPPATAATAITIGAVTAGIGVT